MLWTIFVILLILWLLGFSLHIAGGLIHILLVVAARGPGHQFDQWPQNSLISTAGKSILTNSPHKTLTFRRKCLMKKYAIALFVLSLATFGFAGSGVDATNARLQAAGSVLQEIMAAPDKGIPEEVLNGAKCIAVVPDMAKGAFIVGGEHGRGVVTCRTAHGWSAPAFISIGGGNFGFQAGAQSVDLVMLFMNDKGVQGLLSSKFELSGEASAAAGPVGRHASAGTDWKMNTEALSYSRSKGLFAGVAVDGAKIQQDNDSTVAIYGKDVSFRKTLSGEVHTPASADSFLAAVNAAEKRANQHETAETK